MTITTRPPRGGALLPLAAAALVTLAGQVDATPRFVLKICDPDGSILIPGEAADPHRDWIEVLAFGNGAHTPESAEGVRLRAAVIQTDFTFQKGIDKSTPRIQEALFRGEVLPSVQIKYLGEAGIRSPGTEPIEVELNHVQVTAYHVNMGGAIQGSAQSIEEVSLNFNESKWIYREHDGGGEVVGETSVDLIDFLRTGDPAFDDDGDGIPNDLDDDDDNDGIPDDAELDAGTNPFVDDAGEDLDGDGQSNGDENIAGTLLNDSRSYFGIESFTHRRTPKGPECTVVLPVKEGRHYRLLAAPDLNVPKGGWLVIDEFDIPPGTPESVMEIVLENALLQNATQLFFHAEVRLMDGAPL